jgi:hypothetical protein
MAPIRLAVCILAAAYVVLPDRRAWREPAQASCIYPSMRVHMRCVLLLHRLLIVFVRVRKGFPSLFRSNEPVPFWAGALCHRFAFFVVQSILLSRSLAEGSQQDLSLSLSTKLDS